MSETKKLLDSYKEISFTDEPIEKEYENELSGVYLKTFGILETDVNVMANKLVQKGIDVRKIQEPYLKKIEEELAKYKKEKELKRKEILNYIVTKHLKKVDYLEKIGTYLTENTAKKKKETLEKMGFTAVVKKECTGATYNLNQTQDRFGLWANIEKDDFELFIVSTK